MKKIQFLFNFQLMKKNKKVEKFLLKQFGTTLRKLRSMQDDVFASEPKFNRAEKIAKFMEWCEKIGIVVDGLELKENPDGSGFGVFATKELRPDDVAMIIPNASMITHQKSKEELGKIIPSSAFETWQVKKKNYKKIARLSKIFQIFFIFDRFHNDCAESFKRTPEAE